MTLIERALGRDRSRSQIIRERRTRRDQPAIRRERSMRAPRPSPQRRAAPKRPAAGSQVRLTALPGILRNTRTLSALMIVAAFWGLRMVMQDARFISGQPVVKGAVFMSPFQVRSIADAAGVPAFQIDPQEVQARLEAYPEIEAAQVRILWPAQVEIKILEREPILVWNDAGDPWLLSRDGVAFIRRDSTPTMLQIDATGPVLSIGQDPLQPAIDAEVIRAGLELRDALGDQQALLYDPEHGFGIVDEFGRKVYFGESGDMQQKVMVYRALGQRLVDKRYPASLISVEDLTAPYYR